MRVRHALVSICGLVLLVGCGPDGPALRLTTDAGTTLVYDAHRQDTWEEGFGGTLESHVRFRMSADDGVPGRAAQYVVTVESARVESPPKIGVRIDTGTPEPESGDALGVEELARSLLGRPGRFTLGANGVAPTVEPDRELRTLLRGWAEEKGVRETFAAVNVLDELLDAPRVASRWLQAAGMLLPPDAYPEPGESWSRPVPPADTLAGRLACTLEVRQEPQPDGTVRLVGEGEFRLVEPREGAPMTFSTGSLTAEAVLDPARGVFTSYSEVTAFDLVHKDGGEISSARWERTLTLVE